MALIRYPHVAGAYLARLHHYWYVHCKLATDSLYGDVGAALDGTRAPLLDLGCGIGLLAHTLRAQGFAATYRGVDNDAVKIDAAAKAALRRNLSDTRFECADLANDAFPDHRGSVTLLDVLQFVPPDVGTALVQRAAACIAPGAKLVIRSGLESVDRRMRFTRGVDLLSRRIGWMNALPRHYPTRDGLDALLARCGLRAAFTPPSGRLPFNNWLIVAERPNEAASALPDAAHACRSISIRDA